MSGSSLYQYSHDENATSSTKEIALAHDCSITNEVELVDCMRNKSLEEIVSRDSKIQFERLMGQNMMKSMNGFLTFAPNIEQQNDQRGLPGIVVDKPEKSLKAKQDTKMPLLIGTLAHETANGIKLDEIKSVFKTGTEFLKAAANSLQLDSLLKQSTQLSSSVLKTLGLPSLEDYLKIQDGVSPDKIIEKLIESTTDIFFNIPSVITADLWSQQGQAFFYQFDHVADIESSGKKFLGPLPLVSKSSSRGKTAHGDELGFLFGINDVFGRKINGSQLNSARDMNARKNFIELIQNFAYFNSNSSNFKLGGKIVNSFSAQSSNFIKVSEKIDLDQNFRFCQLSIYGAPLKSAQKVSCDFIADGLKKLPVVPKNIGGIFSGKPIGFK
jgi:carboxylesterase type B